ncbi:MAG: molybdopterin-binding protein [Steroidobacteraceae bacterium]
MNRLYSRRTLVRSMIAGASSLAVAGCDRIGNSSAGRTLLYSAEGLTYRAQRLITNRNALAREFSLSDLSPVFRTNGNTMPAAPEYQRHLSERFVNWRLVVDGSVDAPVRVSLADLLRLPQRTQITRHDCVEGWSAIGQWTGVAMKVLLDAARPRPSARYVVLHCADDFRGTMYYESIDMVDAYHPQTILAHSLNGQRLPVGNGAPLRLRVERQLGYKQAKYVMRLQLVDSLKDIGAGRGGYWEDKIGYEWYAGI